LAGTFTNPVSYCQKYPPQLLTKHTAAFARRFIEEFLFPNARTVFADLVAGDARDDHARWIAEFMRPICWRIL
jgi:hypothetical protein